MATEPVPLDISDMPDLLRIAEEVNATGEPRVLRSHNRDIAVVTPIAAKAKTAKTRTKFPPKTKEQLDSLRSAAGGWKDVDTDKLIEYIYEGRRSSKPPVDL